MLAAEPLPFPAMGLPPPYSFGIPLDYFKQPRLSFDHHHDQTFVTEILWDTCV